uniref:CBS domain-containing protein n=1 Tax=Terrapene triunguis TaxID=2587831 RepID=A0A674I1D6_9SAUR
MYERGAMLPKPRFLHRTIQELGVGTFRDVAKVLETASVYMALEIFVDRRVSALPVTNEAGTAFYSLFQVKMESGVTWATPTDRPRSPHYARSLPALAPQVRLTRVSLGRQVHRLVLVDEKKSLRGIVSLSDILQALVLSPAGIDALNS